MNVQPNDRVVRSSVSVGEQLTGQADPQSPRCTCPLCRVKPREAPASDTRQRSKRDEQVDICIVYIVRCFRHHGETAAARQSAFLRSCCAYLLQKRSKKGKNTSSAKHSKQFLVNSIQLCVSECPSCETFARKRVVC